LSLNVGLNNMITASSTASVLSNPDSSSWIPSRPSPVNSSRARRAV
jgi:hypothetical protein